MVNRAGAAKPYALALLTVGVAIAVTRLSWPFFAQSYAVGEHSSNAGGLLRWPVKLLLPVGFFLMALQGISELIKRIAALEHVIEADFKYEKPLQ